MAHIPDHDPFPPPDLDLADLQTFPSIDGKLEAEAIQSLLKPHGIDSYILRSQQEASGFVVKVARGDLPEAQHILRQEKAATPEPESLTE